MSVMRNLASKLSLSLGLSASPQAPHNLPTPTSPVVNYLKYSRNDCFYRYRKLYFPFSMCCANDSPGRAHPFDIVLTIIDNVQS